jgi:hypothetical protein
MLIYVNITDRQTDKHIKIIVRNLTKLQQKKILQKKKTFYGQTDGQPKTTVWNLTKNHFIFLILPIFIPQSCSITFF